MKYFLILLFAVSTILMEGCAVRRQIVFEVPGQQTTAIGAYKIAPLISEEIFRNVAGEFKFQVLSPTNFGTIANHTAIATEESPTRFAYLDVYMSKNNTVFQCGATTSGDLQKLVAALKQELDRHALRYTMSKVTSSFLNN